MHTQEPSGAGPWLGFLVVFIIVALIYPPILGVAIAITFAALLAWFICRTIGGDTPPFG